MKKAGIELNDGGGSNPPPQPDPLPQPDPYQQAQQQAQFCSQHPFTVECTQYSPTITPETYSWAAYPPPGYQVMYYTRTNPYNIDWIDMVLNVLGLLGNGGQAAADAGILTEPISLGLKGPTAVVEALSLGYDAMKAYKKGEASGMAIDLSLKGLQATSAARLVPYAGAFINGVDIRMNIANAQETVAYLVPINCCRSFTSPLPDLFPTFPNLRRR